MGGYGAAAVANVAGVIEASGEMVGAAVRAGGN